MSDDVSKAATPGPPAAGEVLSHLEQAEAAFQEQQRDWEATLGGVQQALDEAQRSAEESAAALEQTRGELARERQERAGEQRELASARQDAERAREELQRAQEELERARGELSSSREELARERERAERHRERAARIAKALADVHRALFRGDVHDLILRACLTITGASRGLYLTWGGPGGPPNVRAAIDVEGYPEMPPSDFLVALSEKVREEQDTLVCNHPGEMPASPERDAERFQNCALAPVTVLAGFGGVVLVADKPDGPFSEPDLEALLSVGDQASVALENLKLQQDLQLAYVSTIATLADAVEAKDPYTHGHCELASHHARLIAERLEISDHERSVTCYAALLHDVGKIGVSDGVLHKPGPLLPEERELVRAHVRVGYDLINNVPALADVATAVLYHHEWYDGNGYPDRKSGEEIPIASRIIAVVDAYGAMTTRRSYKEALPDEYAREELKRFAGTQFDPEVVGAFLDVLSSQDASFTFSDDLRSCGFLSELTMRETIPLAGS